MRTIIFLCGEKYLGRDQPDSDWFMGFILIACILGDLADVIP